MIAYMLVNAFTGSVSVSCKVIPSFSATRREANSCSSGSNGTLEIRLLHFHAKQALAVMLIIVWRFVYLRKIPLL